MSEPIVVRTTKRVGHYPKGTELGYRTEGDARAILGEGNYTVVGQQNGQPVPAKKTAGKKGKE